MLIQPSSLSQLVYRIGDTLRFRYGIDPVPIYEELGVDPAGPADGGERQSNRVVDAMFQKAFAASEDPAIGIEVGLRSEPRHFFVIGHVWIASATLADALGKLVRYEAILNSGNTDLRFERRGDYYVLSEGYPNMADYPGKLRADNGLAGVLKMCSTALGEPLQLERLDVYTPEVVPLDIYQSMVQGPVRRHDERSAMYFAAEVVERPLPGSIPELIDSTSHIADRYLNALDCQKVAHQVRAQLVQLLPGGRADQDRVAAKLYRSASTLQRQLSAEGTTYRDVLDSTRQELAEAYLRNGHHSQAHTAFLVGFADQSAFARAFKRWTGMTPGQYRKVAIG